MRLLFLTPYLPGPPIFGGQRRLHGLMTHLAKSHEVSCVALTDGYHTHEASLEDTRSYCRHVVDVPETRHRVNGRPKRLLQIKSVLSLHSWEHYLYSSPKYQRALDAHLAEHEYDIIVSEFIFMAYCRIKLGKARARTRLVIDEHNVEYDLLRRTADATRFDRKFFHSVNWRKLKREEVNVWKSFDGCTLTSTRDEEIVRADAPSVRTAVVPNGVDVDGFVPRPDPIEPMTLLFFGAMNYYPNTDGAVFFAREVWPLLAQRYPELRLRIVGPVGEGPVMDLKSDRIEVVGFVTDVQAEIARAAVVVAPLRIGGGTRLKILEAMSMAKAIVSTRIGAEGIDVRHGHDILLADDPADQAREIGRLLDDPAFAKRLGESARETAVARYSWQASATRLEEFFRDLLARPAR
jgi:glycosyltransferase involved in cell wall biosynthesis